MSKLNVPLFKQGDSAWGNEKLGTSQYTLASDGCVITAMAMLAKFYGKDTNPSKLNQDTVRVGGFVNDSLYAWASITKIYPDIKFTEIQEYPFDPAPVEKYRAEIENGRPFLIWLDVNPRQAGNQMHWIIVIGYEGDDFLINDPLYGETYFFKAKYGDITKEALGHRFYKKLSLIQRIVQPLVPDKDARVKELEAQVGKLQDELAGQKTKTDKAEGKFSLADKLLREHRAVDDKYEF